MKLLTIAAFLVLLVGSNVADQQSVPNLQSISKSLVGGLCHQSHLLGIALKDQMIKAGLDILLVNSLESEPFPFIQAILGEVQSFALTHFEELKKSAKPLLNTAIDDVNKYSLSLTDDAQIQECAKIVQALINIRALSEELPEQLNNQVSKLFGRFEAGYKKQQSNNGGISVTALEGLVNNLKDSVTVVLNTVIDYYRNMQCNKDPVCTLNGVAHIVQYIYNLP